MKKTVAILLLLLFSFNLFGYQLLLGVLQQKADTKLEFLIDHNEYDEADLLELRVPLNMPYQQRYTEFERYYGQISIEGTTYQYVKRKIEGDVLVLKCIPHHSKDRLNNLAAVIAHSNSNSEPTPAKSTVKVFSFECEPVTETSFRQQQYSTAAPMANYQVSCTDGFLAAPYSPPRFNA